MGTGSQGPKEEQPEKVMTKIKGKRTEDRLCSVDQREDEQGMPLVLGKAMDLEASYKKVRQEEEMRVPACL